MTPLEKFKAERAKLAYKFTYGEHLCEYCPHQSHPIQYYDFVKGFDAALRSTAVRELCEALEFECGNNCHPEHNPCNARETLANFNEILKGLEDGK